MVEQRFCKAKVVGSIPSTGSSGLTKKTRSDKIRPIEIPMSQDTQINLECEECKNRGYQSTKNKKTLKNRLMLSKFCKWCRKHTSHKETK